MKGVNLSVAMGKNLALLGRSGSTLDENTPFDTAKISYIESKMNRELKKASELSVYGKAT